MKKAIIFVILLMSFVLTNRFIEAMSDRQQLPIKFQSREDSIPANAIKMNRLKDDHPPQLHSSEYQQPVALTSIINTAGGEDSPFITPDGNTLYFFFTPDVKVPANRQLFDGVTGIYASRKQNGEWSRPKRLILQDEGKLSLDGCEFVQGDKIWICSAREGYTGLHWFIAELKNGKWQNWRYADDNLNKKDFKTGELHITADGNELYAHSARAGGKGQYDIWVWRKVGGKWQEPENVRIVNTSEMEGWPFVSQDGNELWFLRVYRGSPAIYRSKKINGRWSEPELIVSQFAGEPSLDNDGNLYFVHHYYKNGQMIEADIYVAKRKDTRD